MTHIMVGFEFALKSTKLCRNIEIEYKAHIYLGSFFASIFAKLLGGTYQISLKGIEYSHYPYYERYRDSDHGG